MVKALHRAGIEVILDVVYNHTAEGNHLGPMLSLRGVDNQSYYRLMPDDPRFYMDYTGTGNTLNPVHPSVLRLIMDSLRYFVIECHVDGFRFDLASALAREFYDVDRLSAFFDIIHQDPVLSQVKLIAEPWDVGPGGYQVGNFPILWSEWNGIYRDTMRDFWRGRASLASFASRFGGSADLYERDGRRPFASVNFITAHDGFTLARPRLVQPQAQRGERRGEPRRHRRQPLVELRRRGARPTIPRCSRCAPASSGTSSRRCSCRRACRCCSAATRSDARSSGNNNAWCQDNEISWFDWESADEELLAFTRRLIELRRAHPVFRRTKFFDGRGRAAARRVVDAARRPPDDAARLGQHRVAGDRRLPERRRAAAPRRGRARRCGTTRSCCSSTRTSTTSRSGCPPAGSGCAGSSSCRRAGSTRTGSTPGAEVVVEARSLVVLRRA